MNVNYQIFKKNLYIQHIQVDSKCALVHVSKFWKHRSWEPNYYWSIIALWTIFFTTHVSGISGQYFVALFQRIMYNYRILYSTLSNILRPWQESKTFVDCHLYCISAELSPHLIVGAEMSCAALSRSELTCNHEKSMKTHSIWLSVPRLIKKMSQTESNSHCGCHRKTYITGRTKIIHNIDLDWKHDK